MRVEGGCSKEERVSMHEPHCSVKEQQSTDNKMAVIEYEVELNRKLSFFSSR